SPPSEGEPTHRQGPKINVAHFTTHTAAYKGKTINLGLRVDEAIDRGRGQSLRNYVGRDVKFITLGPKGEQLKLVSTIPPGLPVPDAGHSDEVRVTFVCTRGKLGQGNEAKAIELP